MNNQKVPGTFLQNNECVCNPPHNANTPAKETVHFKKVPGTFWHRYLLVLLCLLVACAAKEPAKRLPPTAEVPAALQAIWDDPKLLLKEVQNLIAQGNDRLALKACERILQAFPKSESYDAAEQLAKELRQKLWLTGTKIGVLLPLTGSYARFGESVLNGMSCALGLFDPCSSPDVPIQLIVKDTQGSPTLASQGALELIEKESVTAILGPLLSSEMEGSARIATDHQIPILLLAPQKRTTLNNSFVFQHSLFPEAEVGAIVEQTLGLRIKKFILFYPQDRYGEEYQNLFKQKLKESGRGKIIAEDSYPTDLPDFVGSLEKLLANLGESSSPVGLFIPDSFRRIVKISEALDTLSPTNLQLIGTSRWHHPKLLGRDFHSLEGSLLDTPFNTLSPREAAQHFQTDFVRAFTSQPAWLEAIGFDALRLIAQAIHSKGNDYPPDVRDALAAIENFPAVVGPLSWNRDGTSAWPLDFVVIREGKFVLLEKP